MEGTQEHQGARLESPMKALGFKRKTAFAKALKVSQPHISNLISGKRALTNEFLVAVSDRYKNVNLNWLMKGEGEMFNPEKQPENGQPWPAERLAPLTLDDLTPVIRRLEREVAELRGRVEAMEQAGRSAGPGEE